MLGEEIDDAKMKSIDMNVGSIPIDGTTNYLEDPNLMTESLMEDKIMLVLNLTIGVWMYDVLQMMDKTLIMFHARMKTNLLK